MKPHYRFKFKNITQPKHSQHNSKQKAYESGPPVIMAEASFHMGGSWGGPLQKHTSPPKLRSSFAGAYQTPGYILLGQPQSNNPKDSTYSTNIHKPSTTTKQPNRNMHNSNTATRTTTNKTTTTTTTTYSATTTANTTATNTAKYKQ